MANPQLVVDEEKLAHRVARQIETDIVEAGFAEGDNLGTEREIAARFRIGRNTLRQALTLVSRSGLARVRRGVDGGLIVTKPEEAVVADALRNFLELAPSDLAELLEARRQFEDLAISLAIERQNVASSAQLRTLVAHGRGNPALTMELMKAISSASGNPYLALIRHMLESLSWSRLRRPDAVGQKAAFRMMDDLRLDLANAILGVDVGRALSINAAIFAHLQKFTDMPDERRIDPAEAVGSPFESAVPKTKGETIAQEIKRKIVAGELVPGDRIGSVNELITAYDTSRGVVRDCARILEQWSIATTVRGKAGGLYVTRPTADSVLRMAGLYLRSVNVRRRALAEVGNVLDLFVAERAARKAALCPPAEIDAKIDPGENPRPSPRERALRHYHIMNEIAASRVVSLLVALHASLVEIAPLGALSSGTFHDPARLERHRLLAAIRAGDPVNARNAMQAIRRHFTFSIPPVSTFGTPAWQGLLDTSTLT